MVRKKVLSIATLLLVLAVALAAALTVYQRQARLEARIALQEQAIEQGIALYQQAMYEEAMRAFESVTENTGGDWRLPYYQGATAVRLKDYERAASLLEAAKVLNRENAEVLYLLGVVYYKLGKLELAEGYFAAALELDPSHEQARGLLQVMVNLQQRQPGDADETEVPDRQPENQP
jgi:tetratricopeptide (TPR) repeat protein